MAYEDLTRVEGNLSIKACTTVLPHPLVFTAHGFTVQYPEVKDAEDDDDDDDVPMLGDEEDEEDLPSGPIVGVDGWLRLRIDEEALEGIQLLRQRLSEAFEFTVLSPGQLYPPHLFKALEAMSTVFAVESAEWFEASAPEHATSIREQRLGGGRGQQGGQYGRWAQGGRGQGRGRGRGRAQEEPYNYNGNWYDPSAAPQPSSGGGGGGGGGGGRGSGGGRGQSFSRAGGRSSSSRVRPTGS